MALTEWDDYLIHQSGNTIDVLENDNPGFVDRFYVGCFSPDGVLHFGMGLGSYPNKNIMDGYVIARLKGDQYNMRLSRHLQGDRANTVIGPLSVKVLEPQKRWGVYLGDNDCKIQCSLEFVGRGNPYLCPIMNIPGVISQGHYFQNGRFKGSITVDGQKFDAGTFVGVRDRSWGFRHASQGGPGPEGFFHLWFHVHFPSFTFSVLYAQMGEGTVVSSDALITKDDGTVITLTDIRHRIEFVPGFRVPEKVELFMKGTDGLEHHAIAKVLSPSMLLTGGGYNRPGEDRGPLSIQGEKWDVSQPVGIDSERYGNLEPIAEFEMDGEKGTGILESSWNKAPDYKYKPSF